MSKAREGLEVLGPWSAKSNQWARLSRGVEQRSMVDILHDPVYLMPEFLGFGSLKSCRVYIINRRNARGRSQELQVYA